VIHLQANGCCYADVSIRGGPVLALRTLAREPAIIAALWASRNGGRAHYWAAAQQRSRAASRTTRRPFDHLGRRHTMWSCKGHATWHRGAAREPSGNGLQLWVERAARVGRKFDDWARRLFQRMRRELLAGVLERRPCLERADEKRQVAGRASTASSSFATCDSRASRRSFFSPVWRNVATL